MIVKTFVAGSLENNNYLLIDENSKEAVLIDCTQENPEIDKTIAELGLKLKYVLLTHGHFDHILGVNAFRQKYSAKTLVHSADDELMKNVDKFMAMVGYGTGEVQNVDGFLDLNDKIQFGTYEIEIIPTPGHTPGCVSYYVDEKCFSGDTLFKESVGRTDLPGGSFEQIKKSITDNLFTLPESTQVFPGHGPTTTIGHEKRYNQFL